MIVFAGLWYLYLCKGSDWIWFFDDMLHTMGGMLLCSFSLGDSRKENISWRTRFLLCMGCVALGSIGWEEFWYYFRKGITGNPEQHITLDDTMSDFLYAFLGGFFRWACYAVTYYEKE